MATTSAPFSVAAASAAAPGAASSVAVAGSAAGTLPEAYQLAAAL
jgi:hypothetical protein